MTQLDYRIDVRRPERREVTVELEFEPSSQDGLPQELMLPTWTPGSYLIREFSRHLGRVSASEAGTGRRLGVKKVAKNRYRIDGLVGAGRYRVTWTVYAHELSVRTADLTDQHAYWNHACLLLWPTNAIGSPARLRVMLPAGWDLACSLPRQPTDEAGSVTLMARDLDHAMDAPCLCGRFSTVGWETVGVAHEAVLDGLSPIEAPPRLAADLAAIVTQTANLFGGKVPYDKYTFLCMFAADGNGGLEHAESTTLLMGRTAIATDKGYRDFLSLAAHEHLHAWNVKRLRPTEFWNYDYERENYSEFLWLVEGWTAYYDDLLCLRAGVFTREQYLEAVAKNINGMLGAPGRQALSLGESSFDAWIRLYRPDENTRNSSQNYYGNGAVAAMCLDLWIRRATNGVRSLDDVFRGLWSETYCVGRGYGREDVNRVLAAVAGGAAVDFLTSLVDETLDPPLAELLAGFGIGVKVKDRDRPWLGVHFDNEATTVASVTRDSPAFRAGLHPGDEILAVSDLRVDSARWSDTWLALARVGQAIGVLFSRRGRIGSCQVVPATAPGNVQLVVDTEAGPAATELRNGWLTEAISRSATVA